MLVKTLEIGWHEAKPIYSCDLQRKTIRLPNGNVAHKFATAGADTHVRVCDIISRFILFSATKANVRYLFDI
jgi:hypothetical protein